MNTSLYKELVVLFVALFLVASLVDRCNETKLHNALVTELDNDLANLDYARMVLLDSLDALNITLLNQQSSYELTLKEYAAKPQKERIRIIHLIDSFAVLTDTGAILSMHGVDSVNRLSFAYQNCEVKSAIKDTIILTQQSVISNDSIAIDRLKQSNKAHAKIARNWQIYTGVLGVITLAALIF